VCILLHYTNRLVHVKKLADACRRAGVEETQRIACPLLPRICGDSEFVIRQALADELGPFCLFLHEVLDSGLGLVCVFLTNAPPFYLQNDDDSRPGYVHTCHTVIPLLTKLLTDHSSDVRTSASKTLVYLAALLDEDDMEKRVRTCSRFRNPLLPPRV